jgi:hypothetical protein
MADRDWSEDESHANLLLRGWINPDAKGPFMRDKKGNRCRDAKGRPVRNKRAKTHPWEYQTRGFLKADSREEQQARAALARLLRSGKVNQHLLDTLANLFEGVERFPSHPDFTPAFERRLVFKQHKKQPDSARRTAVATYVWRDFRKHGQVEAAVAGAMKHYNLSRSQVYEIWDCYKPAFERDPWLAHS